MEKLTILTADLLDILFEYRNKNYGAYELRRTYPKRVAYSLAATFFICLLFAGGTILANAKKTKSFAEVTDIELSKIIIPEKPPVVPPPPPPPAATPPPVEMTTHNVPLIVKEDIPEEQQVKPIEELAAAQIGGAVQHGNGEIDVIAPPLEKVTVIKEPLVKDPEPAGFIPVQIEASFPGGLAGWTKYLERSLNRDLPAENGAPAGTYTVIVSFIVDKSGAISDVKAETDPGYGTKAEAIRVIQKGPNWNPAVQNGRAVIYRHKQSITFKVAIE